MGPSLSFELQPTLQSELLELRPLRPDDFEALFACASDPLIWEQHPQPTRYQRAVFRQFFESAIDSGGAFGIYNRKAGEIIGSSRYYDFKERRITIGYTFLMRPYWGGRYNRELKTLMLEHAFRFVDSVYFEIGETNTRSRRAIEKIGATLVETRTLDAKTHCIYRIQKSR